MLTVDEFLEHHGVKGMKWGVRRSKVPNTKGYSKDAKRATAIRTKAKTSPVKVKALTNEEINTFLNRVSLEARFAQATPSKKTQVMASIRGLLGVGRTMNEDAKFADSPSGQAIRTGIEKSRAKTRPNSEQPAT